MTTSTEQTGGATRPMATGWWLASDGKWYAPPEPTSGTRAVGDWKETFEGVVVWDGRRWLLEATGEPAPVWRPEPTKRAKAQKKEPRGTKASGASTKAAPKRARRSVVAAPKKKAKAASTGRPRTGILVLGGVAIVAAVAFALYTFVFKSSSATASSHFTASIIPHRPVGDTSSVILTVQNSGSSSGVPTCTIILRSAGLSTVLGETAYVVGPLGAGQTAIHTVAVHVNSSTLPSFLNSTVSCL